MSDVRGTFHRGLGRDSSTEVGPRAMARIAQVAGPRASRAAFLLRRSNRWKLRRHFSNIPPSLHTRNKRNRTLVWPWRHRTNAVGRNRVAKKALELLVHVGSRA